jgi:hypothetical protein
MQSDAMDANGRCDLRVEEVCFDQPCRGVGYALGDYGLFADTFCDDGATSLQAVDVAPGCTVRAARIGGDPVRFVVRQGDMIVAEGDESVEFEPDELGDVRIEVTGAPGARYILSGGVHCL